MELLRSEATLSCASFMRFGYSSFDHRVRLHLACAVGLACSLLNTRVSRAEDTPVDEAPAPTRTSQPQQRSDTERPLAMPVEAVAEQDYSDLLTVSYVVGPLLGFGMTLGLVYFAMFPTEHGVSGVLRCKF